LEKLKEKYPAVIGFILSGKAGLPSENAALVNLLDDNYTEMRKDSEMALISIFSKQSQLRRNL